MPRRASSRKHRLVEFERPPVGEVVISAQFASPAIDFQVLAGFTVRVRDDFPGQEHHPPLPPIVETFDVLPVPLPPFQITFGQQMDVPRTWFVRAAGDMLIQLQSDRMTLNWRRTGPEAEYPGFDAIKARFSELFGVLESAIDELHRERPRVNLCEVAYVNPADRRAARRSMGIRISRWSSIGRNGDPEGRFYRIQRTRKHRRAFVYRRLTARVCPVAGCMSKHRQR